MKPRRLKGGDRRSRPWAALFVLGCSASTLLIEPILAQTPPEVPHPEQDEDCKREAQLPDPSLPDPEAVKAPKFVCPTPKVTAEPVWRGKNLLFNFEIRNEGTADLEYRIKGG